MLLKILLNSPITIGLLIMLLMWSDYFLSILQEKERKSHYSEHYHSYPVNTIEGNPALVETISQSKSFNFKHFIISLVFSIIVPISLLFIPRIFHEIFLGYIWGLFLIVITQHLSNLIGYRISRKGVHGKIWLHQRTGLLIQSGRYLSITLFLIFLSILSESQIIIGITVAGISSTLRLYIRSRKISPIEKGDPFLENIQIEN